MDNSPKVESHDTSDKPADQSAEFRVPDREEPLDPFPTGLTTVQKLIDVLNTQRRRTTFERVLGFFGSSFPNNPSSDKDCDEVYPRICLGNGVTAANKAFLMKEKITHVINAAEGGTFGNMRIGRNYYHGTPINYLGFELDDCIYTNISKFFNEAADFMDEAVESGGRVFVNCRYGVSRSATLVIAYLMIKKNMSAVEAVRTVKHARDVIRPNDGFLQQLAHLDNQLRKRRRG